MRRSHGPVPHSVGTDTSGRRVFVVCYECGVELGWASDVYVSDGPVGSETLSRCYCIDCLEELVVDGRFPTDSYLFYPKGEQYWGLYVRRDTSQHRVVATGQQLP